MGADEARQTAACVAEVLQTVRKLRIVTATNNVVARFDAALNLPIAQPARHESTLRAIAQCTCFHTVCLNFATLVQPIPVNSASITMRKGGKSI